MGIAMVSGDSGRGCGGSGSGTKAGGLVDAARAMGGALGVGGTNNIVGSSCEGEAGGSEDDSSTALIGSNLGSLVSSGLG